MDKQDEQKITAIRGIDPDLFHRAKMAALQFYLSHRIKKTIGRWINEAILEKLKRDKGG